MILFFGDVHGDFRHVERIVARYRPAAIIFLGDLEAPAPLEQVLARVLAQTQVWYIHGNHDTDNHRNYDHLFGSALAERNLHGRVVEIAGMRIAGLGGVFRAEIWYPDRAAAPVHYDNYQMYQQKSEAGQRLYGDQPHGNLSEGKARGLLLRHRSSIFHQEWQALCCQQADILVTHEAPDCHPYGFRILNQLAREMGVKTLFHGHQHDSLNYRPYFRRLGFHVYGVGLRGVCNLRGQCVRAGEMEVPGGT